MKTFPESVRNSARRAVQEAKDRQASLKARYGEAIEYHKPADLTVCRNGTDVRVIANEARVCVYNAEQTAMQGQFDAAEHWARQAMLKFGQVESTMSARERQQMGSTYLMGMRERPLRMPPLPPLHESATRCHSRGEVF